jgi:hypothetical protein
VSVFVCVFVCVCVRGGVHGSVRVRGGVHVCVRRGCSCACSCVFVRVNKYGNAGLSGVRSVWYRNDKN